MACYWEINVSLLYIAQDINLPKIASTSDLEQQNNASNSLRTNNESTLLPDDSSSHIQIIKWEQGDPENPFNWPLVCTPLIMLYLHPTGSFFE